MLRRPEAAADVGVRLGRDPKTREPAMLLRAGPSGAGVLSQTGLALGLDELEARPAHRDSIGEAPVALDRDVAGPVTGEHHQPPVEASEGDDPVRPFVLGGHQDQAVPRASANERGVGQAVGGVPEPEARLILESLSAESYHGAQFSTASQGRYRSPVD